MFSKIIRYCGFNDQKPQPLLQKTTQPARLPSTNYQLNRTGRKPYLTDWDTWYPPDLPLTGLINTKPNSNR
ncbi:hypothetical protein HYN43_002340 [Mucilaginibacter celer]|uniref:Uncharacterized protein n=1 Tax=Mucilaginibacter celer TaxID=2305508 RepID=A0A494VS78_9SPHI|nr:hypothetical protein HYN43_002340 [Mucilaginibacter celer]